MGEAQPKRPPRALGEPDLAGFRRRLEEAIKRKSGRDRKLGAWLAKRTKIPPSTINPWLSDTPPEYIDRLRRVAQALDISMDWLWFGPDEAGEAKQPCEAGTTSGVDESALVSAVEFAIRHKAGSAACPREVAELAVDLYRAMESNRKKGGGVSAAPEKAI